MQTSKILSRVIFGNMILKTIKREVTLFKAIYYSSKLFDNYYMPQIFFPAVFSV